MDIQTLIEKAGGVGKFASLMGVSHSTVCDWKRGNFLPGSRVSQAARVLALPVSDIVGLVREPPSRRAPAEQAAA